MATIDFSMEKKRVENTGVNPTSPSLFLALWRRDKIKFPALLPGVFDNYYIARVAELVDAHGSGPCVLTDVLVRLQSRARESRQLSAFLF